MSLPDAGELPKRHRVDVHFQDASPFVEVGKNPLTAGKRIYAGIPALASPDGASTSSTE